MFEASALGGSKFFKRDDLNKNLKATNQINETLIRTIKQNFFLNKRFKYYFFICFNIRVTRW